MRSFWVFVLSTLIACSALPAFAQKRDSKQASVLIFDFDGSLAKMGAYRLYRVQRLDGPFAANVTALPEMVRVASADFEGSVGLQIQKRIGKFERSKFLMGPTLDAITLSDGQKIVPGYYYFDPNRSLDEFGRSSDPSALLSKQVEQKIAGGEKFLESAYPFFAMAHNPKYQGMFVPVVLTMRGGESVEMRQFFEKVHEALKIPAPSVPDEAFVNLTHPSFYEFGQSKITYIRRAYKELSERVIQNFSTPHFLVVFENDRQHLIEIEEEFRGIASRGEFANPVVPILVNLVEQEVLNQPNGVDWNRTSIESGRAMARVNVYWPDNIERSNDIERVFQLLLGDKSKVRYSRYSNSFMCRGVLR